MYIVKWVNMPLYIAKFPFYYCGKFLNSYKVFMTHTMACIPTQEDLIKYPDDKSGYKKRSYMILQTADKRS